MTATIVLTPHGHLRFDAAGGTAETSLAPEQATRLELNFHEGAGAAVLHLAMAETSGQLPQPFAFWRELGRLFMAQFCAVPDLERHKKDLELPSPTEKLKSLLDAAPPMMGGEYLTLEVLATLWDEVLGACRRALAGWEGSVAEFLEERAPVWHLAGRVHFHLAERKDDARAPFAFLATYTTRPGDSDRLMHVPLGKALTEYAGDQNREGLLALLRPVLRAAETSPFVRSLVNAGAIYHPLAWSPSDAFRFLQELPACEAAGVVVRVPDWWRVRAARPQVRVTAGTRPPAGIGLDAMLDFQVDIALGGEVLSQAEVAALLAGAGGLVRIKGQWVELDREKLTEVLEHWKQVERDSPDGVSFLDAMRLLSGANIGADGSSESDSSSVADWSTRVDGPWLAEALEGLRQPAPLASGQLEGRLKATLRPYQEAGAGWLWRLDRLRLGGCLADDMGLGKTIQVLALMLMLQAEKRGPHLLVVPASLIANWKAEIERFAPGLRPLIVHPSTDRPGGFSKLGEESLAGHDLAITSYGCVMRVKWLAAVKWDVLVADEAQAIKNPSAKQTRALKALHSRLRLALTGTPVENRLSDLWSIFDFINPGLLGNAKAFGAFAKRLEGREREQFAPLRRLIRPYVLRRLKTDRTIISDLPDKTEVRAWCPLSRSQAALYKQSVDELARQLDTLSGIRRRGIVLAYLTRFKQICNHPSQWLGDGGWQPGESGKFGRLAEIAAELAERQEKALVFTQYRELTDPLSEHLAGIFGRPGLVLHGETPIKKRRDLVERFQSDETVPFLVLSLKAGGTGLNLTAASHVIHFDRWWNPAVEDQATDRAFRIGQKKNVLVHKFVCRGTVEERIEKLLESKQKMSRELLEGGAEAVLTELGDKELMELVSLDIETAMADS